MSQAAVILGLSGPKLMPQERAFFRDLNPWAFILFARNVESPEQLKRLNTELRESVGRDALIFVDQEGGRVQRLRAPHWRPYPTGAAYAAVHDANPVKGRRAIHLGHRLIADDLRAVGITADCAPVLDLPQEGADPIISDRAFGTSVEQIIDLAHAAMSGLMLGGVAPVVKHIPGHGRATVDSHKALPQIDTALDEMELTDFLPFRNLSDAPMAMTAHAVLGEVDAEPVTLSRKAIIEIIRARIGFDGLLMSDDLDMKALAGNDLAAKTEAALDAGCDIALQCSGKMADMVRVAAGARGLEGRALERARIAEFCGVHASEFNRQAAEAEFDALMDAV